jgi:N-acetylmuramoyl-L-alanine amidase
VRSAAGQGCTRTQGLPSAMRPISLIAIHCSATLAGRPFSAADIRSMHVKGNGWPTIGYHAIIEINGTVVDTLSHKTPGIHIRGHNRSSVGMCYIGGIGADGKAVDTRTARQRDAMSATLRKWRVLYPDARIRGHRDLSPDLDGDGVIEPHEWLKACPCFDVAAWCRSVGIDPK